MTFRKIFRIAAIVGLCATLSSCEPPEIYGSIGFSSFGGGYPGGIGTSVRIGGRIY